MTRRNRSEDPNAFTVNLAEQLYQMWHEKSPTETFEEELFGGEEPPSEAYAMGRATHILYKSDKWEADGDYFNYIHKFDSLPTLYATDGTLFPRNLEADHMKSVSRMMGVSSFNGTYGFPVLAQVEEITYEDNDGVKRKIKFKSYKPVMSCSVNRKTLVIFADELLLVHGGRMTVSAPGIVY